jgi:hypothetical protein
MAEPFEHHGTYVATSCRRDAARLFEPGTNGVAEAGDFLPAQLGGGGRER